MAQEKPPVSITLTGGFIMMIIFVRLCQLSEGGVFVCFREFSFINSKLPVSFALISTLLLLYREICNNKKDRIILYGVCCEGWK